MNFSSILKFFREAQMKIQGMFIPNLFWYFVILSIVISLF